MTPEAIVKAATDEKLDVIAVADHNEIGSVQPTLKAAEGSLEQLSGFGVLTHVVAVATAKCNDLAADVSVLEAEIDQIVYALYGLTKNEIALIEDRPISPKEIILS